MLERLPRGAHVVIMTHDHAEDFALCDAALRLGRALGGIGLIGSSVKWTRFQAQLAELGHGPEAIARITCPIGLPAITGKDPAVIAVAVAAELLASLTANQRATAPPGLPSEERARREGEASKGGPEASGKAERPHDYLCRHHSRHAG